MLACVFAPRLMLMPSYSSAPFAICSILDDLDYHSGEEIGEALDVSRTAVWKQINKLIEEGLPIEKHKTKGYRFSQRLSWLDHEVLRSGLKSIDSNLALDLHVVLESTNSAALSWLESNVGDASLLVCAEKQTGGRGRRGKTWISPLGRNLYLSLTQSFDGGAGQLSGLSLVVGLAVAETLIDLGYVDVELKWPNDILVNGRKLGGILIEMAGDLVGQCNVVIGLGLNLTMSDALAESIDQPWADLRTLDPEKLIDKNQLLLSIVAKLYEYLGVFRVNGLGGFMEQWKALDCYYQKDVVVSTADGSKTMGKHIGIADDGALLVQVGGQTLSFSGGEVSLRLEM